MKMMKMMMKKKWRKSMNKLIEDILDKVSSSALKQRKRKEENDQTKEKEEGKGKGKQNLKNKLIEDILELYKTLKFLLQPQNQREKRKRKRERERERELKLKEAKQIEFPLFKISCFLEGCSSGFINLFISTLYHLIIVIRTSQLNSIYMINIPNKFFLFFFLFLFFFFLLFLFFFFSY